MARSYLSKSKRRNRFSFSKTRGQQRATEADTRALEREIDELVYALYGLSDEETALVEGAAK